MKVLHVAESIWGGCGTYLNEIVPLQIESLGAGHVLVIAPAPHLAILTDIPRGNIAAFRRPGRPLGLVFLMWRLIRTLRQGRPDLIHAHSTFAGALVRVLVRLMPNAPKIVYCPHGWVFDTAKGTVSRRWMQTAERIQSRRTDAIVCISQAEKEAALAAGIHPGKLTVIPNGIRPSIDISTHADWQDHRIKALFVGRLDRQKGVDILIEAVRNRKDLISVRIVGESVVAEQGLRTDVTNIEYLGWLTSDAVAAQMNACDVVVMPSRWEGFGLVAIEAMRAAKQVVAASVGGLVEIIVDGVTGRLFPVGSATELTKALLADSAEARIQMGRAGRDRFLSLYSIRQTHTRLVALYEKLLGSSA